jgi:hypothetical protein
MNRLAKAGSFALRVYCNHMLVFALGCVAGAVEAFVVLAAIWGACG